MPANGIHPLSREEYEKEDRERFSVLCAMGQSPAHYRYARANASEANDAMRLGTAAHTAIFEPHLMERYHVWEKRRAGKAWDKFLAKYGEDNILTLAQWESAHAIGQSARTNPDAAGHLVEGRAEISVLWTHKQEPFAGIQGFSIDLKARLDWLGETAILDLKSCRDASPDAFSRAAWDRKMYVQAAMYVDGVEAVTGKRLPYLLLAVENEAPYVSQVYAVPEALLERGRREYRDWLSALAMCRAAKVWPGYATGPVELQLPKWAHDYEQEMA